MSARGRSSNGTNQNSIGTKGNESLLRRSKAECPTSALGQKQTFTRLTLMSALPPKADIRRHAGHRVFGCDGAGWSSSLTEERDHACLREPPRSNTQKYALEQGKADRGKTSLPAEARVVYPNETAIGGTTTRPGNVQPGNRQQAPRLRRRCTGVEDIAPNGYANDRAIVRQRKTGQSIKFELTEQTRQTVDDYLTAAGKRPGDFLFAGRRSSKRSITTRQYARLVSEWVASIGLDPHNFGTHSLRRTKATLIYRRTGNLRAVQLLLGHRKIESTARYLGIEVDDALTIAEQVDI
jgi:hypothetical protein